MAGLPTPIAVPDIRLVHNDLRQRPPDHDDDRSLRRRAAQTLGNVGNGRRDDFRSSQRFVFARRRRRILAGSVWLLAQANALNVEHRLGQ
jgi:hypothetical protein